MEDLTNYTSTELLKLLNDISSKHTNLKENIIKLSYEFDEIERKINNKIEELKTLESDYVSVVTEMDSRK